MWAEKSGQGTLYSDDELRNKVLAALTEPKLIFLDGPTMCGKTRFLENLPADLTSISGFNLLLENYIDGLHAFLGNHDAFAAYKENLIKTYQGQSQITCFEDIDMSLAGKSVTQEEFAYLFRMIAETNTVILTGIDIDRRCPELLSKCVMHNYDYYKWVVKL